MIRKYNNHKSQTNQWHCEKEPHNNHETPGSNKPLFAIKMIEKLEWT